LLQIILRQFVFRRGDGRFRFLYYGFNLWGRDLDGLDWGWFDDGLFGLFYRSRNWFFYLDWFDRPR